MGRYLKGKEKPGGLVGREEFYITDFDGIQYVVTTQELADLAPVISEITTIDTTELDTDLVLKPNGSGGVVWGVDGGGGFTLTDGSGTTANGTAVDLGGILTADAEITGLYDIRFGTTLNKIVVFEVDASQTLIEASSQNELRAGGEVYLNSSPGQYRVNNLPTADPQIAGRIYSNGTPSGGSPVALYISGGPGGGPCITGDALISLSETETIRFDAMKQSVLTYNKETLKNEVQTFDEVVTKEHENLVRITLEGIELKCTAAHPWMSRRGWVSLDVEGSKSYYNVDAQLLTLDDKLQTKEGTFKSVISIDAFVEKQITYHLKGIKNGNYYANGVLTPSMV